MSTAALLGLESSKSYQSLKQIQGSLRELFNVRAQDQASEERFYKQTNAEARRAAEDAKRFDRGTIKTAHDYERTLKSGGGSGGMGAGAALLATGLVGAALLGKTNALKKVGGKVFDKGSDFVKNFTENFNRELDKEEKKGSTSSPSSTSTPTSTPAAPPTSRIRNRQYKGKKDKNYQAYAKIYNLAVANGDPFPEMTAAQAMFESGWLTSKLAKKGNNPFGQSGKGDAGYVDYQNASIVSKTTGWAKYSSYDAAVKAHIKRWSTQTPQGNPGYGTYDTPAEALAGILENYAPAKDANNHTHYINGVNNIMKKYGFDPNKKNPVTKMQKGGVLQHAMNNGAESENKLALKTALNPQIMDGKQPTINLPGFQRGGKIFLHWAASGYNSNFPQNYHTVFKGDGTAQRNQSYSRFRTRKGHTWRRNGQGVGLSMASMGGDDPWSTPTTDAQVNAMANEIASIAKNWGWNKEDINSGNVMTHAEVAKMDGYFGERWDLWHIKKNDPKGSGGDRIRALARAKFDGSASPQFQGPGEDGSGNKRDSEGDGREMGEQDRDQPIPRSEMNQPVVDEVKQNFKQYGPFGELALKLARKINAAAGFDLFPGIGTGAPANNIQAQEQQVQALTQPQAAGQPQTPQQKKEAEKEPTREEAKKNTEALQNGAEALKNIQKASHPNTGAGYTISGLKDYKGRPAVFSQAAAFNFEKMMNKSGGKMKGTDISSTQRSKSYNAQLPGAHPNSSHLYGEAIDVIDSSMDYMKAHGKKFGWHYGYSHGPNSAHFNYKGPEKLNIQGKQAGGTVQMHQSGGIATQFNDQHRGSFIKNKYGRRTIVVKRAPSSPAQTSVPPTTHQAHKTTHKQSLSELSTSMYKIQLGAFC